MATINWNDNFIALPIAEDNPGEGAEAIRDVRKGVDERMKEDHFWGEPNEVDGFVGGRHIEGSAVIGVLDEDSTQRVSDGEKVERYLIGVPRVDMNPLGAGNWREVAGTELNTETPRHDNRKKKLQLYFTDADSVSGFVDIFNPDEFVSMFWNQTIGGDKVFSRAAQAPADDESAAVIALPADFNPSDPDYDTEYVIPAKIFWKWLKNAKYHDLFDKSSSDNTTLLSATAGIHGALYIDKDISANVIEGEIIRGAVYA